MTSMPPAVRAHCTTNTNTRHLPFPIQTILTIFVPLLLMIFLSIFVKEEDLILIRGVDAGCYEKKMCCTGRNQSCLSFESGSSNEKSTKYFNNRAGKIERVKFYDPQQSLIKNWQFRKDRVNQKSTIHSLKFGSRLRPQSPPKEKVFFKNGHKIGHYFLLNQHIPVLVNEKIEKNKNKYAYLETGPGEENGCFCDSECLELGDCCSDYTLVCQKKRDCQVSTWTEWTSCLPHIDKNDNHNNQNTKKQLCTEYAKKRLRKIESEAKFGGRKCPKLAQTSTCSRSCQNSVSLPTALLLPYRYALTRQRQLRDNIYYDLPRISDQTSTLLNYCIVYEIGWINRNCRDKWVQKQLYDGERICAECQPMARLHRSDLRCAAELNDGENGFWKLIGPNKYCLGKWKRVNSLQNCTCQMAPRKMQNYPHLLLV